MVENSNQRYIPDIPETSRFIKCLVNFLGPRRRIIHSNLDIVFNDRLSIRDKQNFTAAFYRHVLKIVFDIIKAAFFNIRPNIDITIAPEVLKHLQDGGRLIAVSGHFGNWELAMLLGLANHPVLGRNLSLIRRAKLKPKYLNNIVYNAYQSKGIKIFLAGPGAIKQAKQHLDKNGLLIFPFDQHANTRDKNGVSLPFFGKEAGCYRSLVRLSHRTQSPVATIYTFYKKNTIFIEVSNFINESPENPEKFLTACNQALEKCILRYPIQWWWWHRRWKLSYDYEQYNN